MTPVQAHILVADLGGTHLRLAIFAHHGGTTFVPVAERTYPSRLIRDFPGIVGRFLRRHGGRLEPPVARACIGYAGPVDRLRSRASVTNLALGFTAADIAGATGIREVLLLNDFEAVGYGLEVMIRNLPHAFVRLSRRGTLPGPSGPRLPAVVIGAGTGLGTTILVADRSTGDYRPVAGEGGHADFVAVDEPEFQIAQWLRERRNRSARNPLDCETIVSGRGLVNLYEALWALEAGAARRPALAAIDRARPYQRPAHVVDSARSDGLARRALDLWLRCYGRVARNCAIFPLAPRGVFLAGGIAARILPEMRSGVFMREFVRCDVPAIRTLLRRTPVWVVTDPRIGLYGCAHAAARFFEELAGPALAPKRKRYSSADPQPAEEKKPSTSVRTSRLDATSDSYSSAPRRSGSR